MTVLEKSSVYGSECCKALLDIPRGLPGTNQRTELSQHCTGLKSILKIVMCFTGKASQKYHGDISVTR